MKKNILLLLCVLLFVACTDYKEEQFFGEWAYKETIFHFYSDGRVTIYKMDEDFDETKIFDFPQLYEAKWMLEGKRGKILGLALKQCKIHIQGDYSFDIEVKSEDELIDYIGDPDENNVITLRKVKNNETREKITSRQSGNDTVIKSAKYDIDGKIYFKTILDEHGRQHDIYYDRNTTPIEGYHWDVAPETIEEIQKKITSKFRIIDGHHNSGVAEILLIANAGNVELRIVHGSSAEFNKELQRAVKMAEKDIVFLRKREEAALIFSFEFSVQNQRIGGTGF